MDPSMMSGMSGMGGMSSMTDPANMITLYKADPGKGKRKINNHKTGGAMSIKKKKS